MPALGASAKLAEARSLLRRRRLHEAALAFASALGPKQRDAAAWLEYGNTLSALEDYPAAVAAFDTALVHRPGFVAAWNDRGVALRSLGRLTEARESLERAVALQPSFAAATTNLANLELSAGQLERAEALYRRALRDDASSGAARTGLGRTLWQTGRSTEACREFERALQNAPGSFDALLALVSFQLGTRRLAEAISTCDRFLRLAPNHSGALGLRSEVGREGRDDRYSHLLDLDRWLKIQDLPADTALHADLTTLLTAELRLTPAPPHHATQGGLHSGPLSSLEHPALARLEELIERELSEYAAAHANNAPWALARPAAVALHTWGVVLGAEGFQLPHLHPDAWLSGVYYVAVPERASGDSDAHAGCLELGRGDPALALLRSRPSRFIQPQPGRLVIFPSWLYHSTIPHGMPGLRISIAFDCVRV